MVLAGCDRSYRAMTTSPKITKGLLRETKGTEWSTPPPQNIGDKAFPSVSRVLSSTNADARAWACCAIGAIHAHPAEVVPMFITLTHDTSVRVQIEAIGVLGRLGWAVTSTPALVGSASPHVSRLGIVTPLWVTVVVWAWVAVRRLN